MRIHSLLGSDCWKMDKVRPNRKKVEDARQRLISSLKGPAADLFDLFWF